MRIENLWYQKQLLSGLLLPLSGLFRLMIRLRRAAYRYGLLKSCRPSVPVIIVGNITVGGSGKTPLVIWLVQLLQQAGYRPGIVSRGYRGQATQWPQVVTSNSDPRQVGDEAVVLAHRSQCPVVVAPRRCAAANTLLQNSDCNIIVADDGLQHYALQRDIELIVIDGQRRFGNGRCLPAGPLREPVSRLSSADFVIVNNGPAAENEYAMILHAVGLCQLRQATPAVIIPLADFRAELKGPLHAVAGIGHPQRFFDFLRQLGFDIIEHAFADHHDFCAADVQFDDELPVVMTEKDAVKCRHFGLHNGWYLLVDARLETELASDLLAQLQSTSTAAHKSRAEGTIYPSQYHTNSRPTAGADKEELDG